MTASQHIPWTRIPVEAAAIVVSILLAFAIDAGWQEYVESQKERDVMIALLSDFEKSKANILNERKFHLAVQQSNTELLGAVTSSDNLLSNDEIERLLGDLGWWASRTIFSTGALNSLVYGGELSNIEDDELRQLLADWPSQIEYVAAVTRQDYDFYLNVLMPYFRKNGHLPKMATLGTPMPGQTKVVSALINLQLDDNWSHLDMVAAAEFHNILVQKWWIQFDILGALDETEERLNQTIQRLENRL